MSEAIDAVIRQFIVETFLSGDSRGFDKQTNLLENRILDSFSALRLVGFLDERFNVRVPPEEIHPGNLATVASLAALVTRLQSAG